MRLYVADLDGQADSLTLDSDRSHYLCRVRRANEGDRVALFDGRGNLLTASITNADKRATELAVTERTTTPGPKVRLGLALALISGDAADRAVQKSVELGVTDIRLMLGRRSNVKHARKRASHLQRVAISACEQCGQDYLPDISLTESLGAATEGFEQVYCLHPEQPPLPAQIPRTDTLVCIGPEGGWSASEIDFLEARNVRFAGLGHLILRAETAPLAALAAIRSGWGWER